jgi:predicted dehydrogenase
MHLKRVLVLGGGSIGERHARCFLATGRCQVAVCDLDAAVRARLAKTYPLAATFASVDEALIERWDAAVIATPAHLHVAQAHRLADLGVALLIEKPLSTTLRGLDALQRAIDARRLVAGVAYVFRTHPAVMRAKELIGSGALGRIHQLRFVSGQHFPTFRPAYRTIYYNSHATGGGAVIDALTHELDLAHHLAGRFSWVSADFAHRELEGVTVEDTVNVLGRLGDGQTLVSFTTNQYMAPRECRLEAHGARGSVRVDLVSSRWSVMMRGETAWRESEALVTERDDLFTRQATAFLDAVEGRAPVPCPLADAAHALRVSLAVLRSGTMGARIDIAEVDESFDPAAMDARSAAGATR